MKTLSGLLLIAVILSGCVSITSKHQLGTKAVELDADKWNGIWSNGKDQVFYFKVKDAKKGILRIAIVADKKDDFKLYKFDAVVRQGDSLKFLNILVKDVVDKDEEELKDKDYADSYYWVLVEDKNDHIMIFFPNSEKIAELIKSGKLKGVKKKSTLILQGSSEEVTKFVESKKNAELFQWKEPMPLRKIANIK